jgi:hypothetical protein
VAMAVSEDVRADAPEHERRHAAEREQQQT